MKILPYLLSAGLMLGAAGTSVAQEPVSSQAHPYSEKPVFKGSWDDAVRYMHAETRKNGLEQSYIYVNETSNLFSISERSQAGEVTYSIEMAHNAVKSAKGKKRHVHTHPNFRNQNMIDYLQKMAGDAEYQVAHDTETFCKVDETNVLASAMSCDRLPEYFHDSQGRVSQPAHDIENLIAKQCLVKEFKRNGVLPAFGLPSGNDLYMSLLIVADEPGMIDLAVVEVRDDDKIRVTSYDATVESNFSAYIAALHDAMMDCSTFDEARVQEIASLANKNGLKISFSYVRK